MSFSGGKDSGVLLNLCIDYIRRNNLKRKIGVFHMDYEVQYKMTIDFVDSILEKNKDLLDVYRICLPFRVATSTSMYQSFWRPWDEEKKDLWVRQMPEGAIFRFVSQPQHQCISLSGVRGMKKRKISGFARCLKVL